jgi:hypothetical protein
MRAISRVEGSIVVVVLALLGQGCGSSGSATDAGRAGDAAAETPVVRLAAEPAGSHCARGGLAVKVGLDRNGNGVLDDAEVTSTSYLCNPDSAAPDGGADANEDGADAPTEAGTDATADAGTDAPTDAGTDAPADAGTDAPADAATDAPADAGTDAPAAVLQPLLRVDPEPAGEHCANGGTVVRAGLDRNQNGTLDDAEVTSSSYACNGSGAMPSGVLEGNMVVHNAIDLALLGLFSEVTGDVDLETMGLMAIKLPGLTKIGGALTGTVTGATSLELPALASVQRVNIDSDALDTVNLQKLETIPVWLRITSPALTSLAVPALRTVAGALDVGTGPTADLSFPSLLTAGAVDVSGARSVALPALTRTALLSVTNASGAVSAPLLDVDSLDAPMNVTIAGVAAGTGTLDLHALRAGCLGLNNLASIDVSSLARIGATCGFSYAGVGLTLLALPALTQGGITVRNADTHCGGVYTGCVTTVTATTITDVSAPVLVSGDIDIEYTTTLKTVSLPSLTTSPSLFRVSNDAALTQITAPKLASVTSIFDVSNNGALPACQATRILAQIAPAPATVDTSGNLTSGTCP